MGRPIDNPSLKQKAINLRTEDKLGLKEISKLLGISKSTASAWLRDFPLTKELIKDRMSENGHKQKNRLLDYQGKMHPSVASKLSNTLRTKYLDPKKKKELIDRCFGKATTKQRSEWGRKGGTPIR